MLVEILRKLPRASDRDHLLIRLQTSRTLSFNAVLWSSSSPVALPVCSQVQRCQTDVKDAVLCSTSGRTPAEVSVLPVRAGPTLASPLTHTLYIRLPLQKQGRKKNRHGRMLLQLLSNGNHGPVRHTYLSFSLITV